MKLTMTVLAATLVAAAALGQTTPGTPATSARPTLGAGGSTGALPGAGVAERNTGAAAASGDRNQAVATTGASAPTPARGASSYTEGQARNQFAEKGYRDLVSLAKGEDGVWRGTAVKDGANMPVWLDYKGNVGQGNAVQGTGGNPAIGAAATTGTSR